MEKLIINGQKKLLMKVFKKKYYLLVLFFSINTFSSEPIAYLNSLGYEPAQKKLASSKNGMITSQHFLSLIHI